MSDPVEAPQEDQQYPQPDLFAWTRNLRRREALEVYAVILLAVLPDLVNAMFSHPGTAPVSSAALSVSLLMRSTQVSIPVLYIIYRSGEGWAPFGFLRFRPFLDLAEGVLLTVGAMVASSVARSAAGYIFPKADPGVHRYFNGVFKTSGAGLLLLALAIAANSVAEELVTRSFMIHRLEKLSKSKAWAVWGSSLLFASYHVYEGSAAALTILFVGLVFGFYFVANRRIAPLIIAHTLYNLIASQTYFRH